MAKAHAPRREAKKPKSGDAKKGLSPSILSTTEVEVVGKRKKTKPEPLP